MLVRVSTCNRMIKAIIVFTFVCMLACFFWCAPRVAWAGDYDDAPVGVLTLCDDPFAVDCGHNHSENDDPSQVCHSASPICHPERSEESPGTPASPEEDFSLQALPFAQDDMGGSSDILNDSTGIEDAQQLYHLVGSIPSNPEEPQTCHSEECSVEESRISAIQTPSTEYASSTASSENSDNVSTASSEDVCVVVDNEGLGCHEAAVVLVEVEPGISRYEFDELIRRVGGLSADVVSDEDLAYGLVKLGITDNSGILNTINRLNRFPEIKSVQPNYIYSTNHISIQESLDDTWANYQWALKSVNALDAWDYVKTSSSVSVAIIDTGADLDHPDLIDNIAVARNSYSSANTADDQTGHGTHVAGIIAGVANNHIGIAGVSYNAQLLIIKATSYKSETFDTASIVRAYEWLMSLDSSGMTVAEHYNVRVVNMSIGGYDEGIVSNMPDDAIIHAMIKARDEYGILTVCAAGNGSPDSIPFPTYPGDSDACLCVMNLRDSADSTNYVNNVSMSPTSNYNVPGTRYKDVCAPGTTIYSTWLEGKYASTSGTSMAAPLVAGIAAMMFAADPYLTPQMVISILEFTALDLGFEGWDEYHGYGEVDALAAVRLANTARLDGWRVVGIGGSASYSASLGSGMSEDGNGRTWRVVNGSGTASVDESGVLTGARAGDITLVSTCTTTSGAEISAMTTVRVLQANITGNAVLREGASSIEYSTTDASYTWVWQVENDTGEAHIDQDAILVADRAGVVYVTATCASNTDIVLRKKVTIVA